ncbi:sensor histidine kinase [Pseudomonas luteola]|uniref:sensor histidine kinase n=1 Tax=Pseudomonas luteola TaxID=47886 RepID=UPI0028999451|nr:ATP-binding protein [Pseudomonas luteola]
MSSSVTPVPSNTPSTDDVRRTLEQASVLFEPISDLFNEPYGWLENRLSDLKGELARETAQRVRELAEKERLANRLQSLLDILPAGIIILDGQGVVCEANPIAVALLGEPLVGTLWRDVIGRCFAPRKDDGHEVSLKSGRRVSLATRSLDGEPGQLIMLSDMTETRRLQEQLARHERLSSMGRMVASLAHQIRTPLSAAMLYAGHLSERPLPFEQQQRFASRLKDRLHELENQVQNMLIFARGELPLNDRVSPVQLFAAIQSIANPYLEDLQLRWQCDAFVGEVLCNRDTFVGAVMNVVHNAVQAAGKTARYKIHAYARQDTLRLSISDSGPGMTVETVRRLGEPFFTTKPMGTGLGMIVARTVAKAHHGDLLIRSRPGRGTCMTFVLPLHGPRLVLMENTL